MKKYYLVRIISVLVAVIFGTCVVFAQSDSSKNVVPQKSIEDFPLKISGVVQVDVKFQESDNKGSYKPTIGVRRGFLKSTYTNKWGQAVLQINATERGVSIKDAYIKLQIPKVEWVNLTAGLFFRPFGYEVSYSASSRETPERARVITSLFPDERDIGIALTFLGTKKSKINGLKFEVGLMNGNGTALEDKSKYGDVYKDVVGRLFYSKDFDKISFGVGVSGYYGKVMLFENTADTTSPFRAFDMTKGRLDTMNVKGGGLIDRYVCGFEGQFSVKTRVGKTLLRAEYLFGTQPGRINTNTSNSSTGYLNSAAAPGDVYLRPFTGLYVYLIQDVFSPKHSLVFRYDYYDPNSKFSGNMLRDGDIKYSTYGAGYMFNPSSNVRILAFYEWIVNEISNSPFVSQKFQKDIKDNLLTLRLQYKF